MAFALRPTASLIPAKGKASAFAACFRNAGQREVNSVAAKRGLKLTEKNRTDDSGGLGNEVSQMKDAERRRQSERLNREGHGVQARLVKTFRKVGDGKKATADL